MAFPMVVGRLSFRPDGRTLKTGDQQLMYSTLEGPEELPDAEWRPGNYPASNLAQAQKLVPGFQMPRAGRERNEEREAEEKRASKEKQAGQKGDTEENEGGQILLVIKNPTAQQVTFRESKDGVYIFHLTADSFKMGEFKYKFVVEAKQAGNFDLQAYVVPFLAPVTGQQFPLAATASGK